MLAGDWGLCRGGRGALARSTADRAWTVGGGTCFWWCFGMPDGSRGVEEGLSGGGVVVMWGQWRCRGLACCV